LKHFKFAPFISFNPDKLIKYETGMILLIIKSQRIIACPDLSGIKKIMRDTPTLSGLLVPVLIGKL